MADEERGVEDWRPAEDEATELDRAKRVGQPDGPGVSDQPLARYTPGPQSRPGLEPGLPTALAPADPIAEAIERLRQGQTRFEAHEAEYDRRDQALREEEEKTFKARETEAAPIREELSRRISEPIERPPQLQQLPQPPDLQKTRKEFQDNATGWMFAATAIAMFGAAKSQNAATAGLQAMQGLFDGLREGNEDKINQEYKVWKAASDTIVKNNRAMADEYKQVLNNRKLDIDQTMQMLELVAAKYQSQFDYEALRRKNLVDWDKNYQNHDKQADIIERAIIYAEAQREKAEAARGKQQMAQAGLFTPEQAAARAERFANGDNTSLYYGLGRGAVKDMNIQAVEQALIDYAKANGWSQSDIAAKRRDLQASAAGLRSSYTQEQRLGTPLIALRGAIPAAEESLDRYWGETGGHGIASLVWDKAANFFSLQQQSPELADLAVKLNAVLMPYSQAMARTGVSTDAIRAEAHRLLSEQQTPEAAKSAMRAMAWEVENELKAARQFRSELQENAGQRPRSFNLTPEQTDELNEAKRVLGERPDLRNKIEERLRRDGIDPRLAR